MNKFETNRFAWGMLLAVVMGSTMLAVKAQSSGGTLVITRSVVATGGGNASAGLVSLDGTIGQFGVGPPSVNQTLAVAGGFWTILPSSPTASLATIDGRVLTPDGRGLVNARVQLVATNGQTLTALTGPFGYFQFNEVATGETYVINIKSRLYDFTSQVVFLTTAITDLNIIGSPK